ncbi:hypothetical protein [Micromonospora sp. NPDC005113]
MALVTGATVLAPVFVGPVVRLFSPPVRRRGGATGLLVRAGAMTATGRTASTAAPVLLTVAFAVLVSGFVRTSTAVYAAGRLSAVSAAWVALPDRALGLTDQAAAATPGAAVLPTTVFVTDDAAPTPIRPLTALGVDPAAFTAATARSPSSPDCWPSCAATTRWWSPPRRRRHPGCPPSPTRWSPPTGNKWRCASSRW